MSFVSKADEARQMMIDPPTAAEIVQLYEGNGLFAAVIDHPAEDAARRGFELDGIDKKTGDFLTESLDTLEWDDSTETAIRWTRLFGGCIGVVLADDGHGLDYPLNLQRIRAVEDIILFDSSTTRPKFNDAGQLIGFSVRSERGRFFVHESRCLIFRNAPLPENSKQAPETQFWGLPEYVRIRDAAADANAAAGLAVRMLSARTLPVYKLSGLAQMLATDQGEQLLLQRLERLETARSLFNTIALDAADDYQLSAADFSGNRELVIASFRWLCAVSGIPERVLFGQLSNPDKFQDQTSLETYYNRVGRLQTAMLQQPTRRLLRIIAAAGEHTGEIDHAPEALHVRFRPLWNETAGEQVAGKLAKAQAQLVRAQTAAAYINAGLLSPREVRRGIGRRKPRESPENRTQDQDKLQRMFDVKVTG